MVQRFSSTIGFMFDKNVAYIVALRYWNEYSASINKSFKKNFSWNWLRFVPIGKEILYEYRLNGNCRKRKRDKPAKLIFILNEIFGIWSEFNLAAQN